MIDDDALDDERAELEARFRDLEQDAELERLRHQAGRGKAHGTSARTPDEDDDLSHLKADLDDDRPPAAAAAEEYLLVVCPGCGARNRTSLRKVRSSDPICGRCKSALASRG